jgi:hypothetical protein
MIVVTFSRYMGKINHDHEKARFGEPENRITVRPC